jgi:hypothetical protein
MHTGSDEPRCYDEVVAAFHAATPNRPTLGLIEGVLHMRFPLLQVGQMLYQLWNLRVGLGQGTQLREHSAWPVVLQMVELAGEPPLGHGIIRPAYGCPHLCHIPCCVRKVQYSCRIAPVVVNEALLPLGSIGHGDNLTSRLHPPAVGLDQGQMGKDLGLRQA